jgi:hypothetical protein
MTFPYIPFSSSGIVMAKAAFKFNPRAHNFVQNPYPVYHQMRQLAQPYRLANTLVLTSYHDVHFALRHPDLLSSGIPDSLLEEFNKNLLPLSDGNKKIITHILLFQDGELHKMHRKSLMQIFSSDALNKLTCIIKHEADMLIQPIASGQTIDIISALAQPLWFKVFCAWLRLDDDATTELYQQSKQIRLLLDPSAITHMGLLSLIKALDRLSDLFHQNYLKNKVSNTPSLFFSTVTEGNNSYHAMDYIIDAITVFIGGGETTGALTGNAIYYLVTLSDIQNQARQNPALMRKIIQEALRLESPLQMTRRRVTQPVRIANTELKIDDHVLLCLGSANRDDRIFNDPDSFSLIRKNAGKQLGFGVGMHQCIGQQLAQSQAEIMCHSLLSAFTTLHYTGATPPLWQTESLILRGLTSLPVRVTSG